MEEGDLGGEDVDQDGQARDAAGGEVGGIGEVIDAGAVEHAADDVKQDVDPQGLGVDLQGSFHGVHSFSRIKMAGRQDLTCPVLNLIYPTLFSNSRQPPSAWISDRKKEGAFGVYSVRKLL